MTEDTNTDDVQRIAINNKHGGFGISDEAAEWLIKSREWDVTEYNDKGMIEDDSALLVDTTTSQYGGGPGSKYRLTDKRSDEIRTHPDLIDVIEEPDVRANGRHASLKVVEVPAGVEWTIEEYGGNECVAEKHKTWS
jgi:hypothetical protein